MPTISAGFDDLADIAGWSDLVQFGPTIQVQIGFDSAYTPGNPTRPNLPQATWPALIDTGATESCIDSALAAQLALPAVDRTTIAGVAGTSEVDVYLAQIYVPGLSFTIHGDFSAVQISQAGLPHYALIGRTFPRHFAMVCYGRSGKVMISND